MSKLLLPIKIIAENNVINSLNLFKEKEKQIHLNEKEVTTLSKGSFIVLDFGKEIAGGLRILTKDASNNLAKIHIRFGESVGECYSSLGYKNSTNDHALRDLYYDIPFLSDVTIGSTGFRFVRIDVEDDVSLSFKNIYAVMDDVKQIDGYFISDDELLNKIFDVAAYTNALCHKNGYYYDGIKRDRLVWIGDAYPIYKASKYLFLKDKEILNSLYFATIESPLPCWVNWSPMYSYWWMLLLAEYYIDNNNFNKVIPLLGYLKGIIYQSKDLIKDNGDLAFHFLFIDWPSHYDIDDPIGNDINKKDDEIVGCRFLILITLRKVLLAFSKHLSAEDIELINLLINRLEKGSHNVKKYKQIAALGVEAGYFDKNKIDILLSNGANGLSTFQSYFIFKAIDELGYHLDSVEQLKEYYGKMLELGATTFFEDFDISWANNVTKIDEIPTDDKKDFHGDHGAFCYRGYRHSLCHGWSSGVVAYIFECIVGVKQMKPNHFVIKPVLGNLKDIKCAFGTKYGLISLEIKDKKVIKVSSPKEVKVEIKE